MKNYDDGRVTISAEEYFELRKAKQVVEEYLKSCMAFDLSDGEICTRFDFDNAVVDVMFPEEFSKTIKRTKRDFEIDRNKRVEIENV